MLTIFIGSSDYFAKVLLIYVKLCLGSFMGVACKFLFLLYYWRHSDVYISCFVFASYVILFVNLQVVIIYITFRSGYWSCRTSKDAAQEKAVIYAITYHSFEGL